MDNRKPVTIPNFVLIYEKDAIYFFYENMMGKIWNSTVCTKTTHFFFKKIVFMFFYIYNFCFLIFLKYNKNKSKNKNKNKIKINK